MSGDDKTSPLVEFGEAEFHTLTGRLGIDPSTAVDPRLGFVAAAARSACRACDAKPQCALALAMPQLALADMAPFCPNTERIAYLQSSGLKRKG
jgi:hypothetical protein